MELNHENNLNYFQKNFKKNNPDKTLPSNLGKKWTEEEENLLLSHLENNADIEIISKKHNRTIGSILSRQKEIAYKLYNKNISIEEIIKTTKLDETIINEYIEKKQYNEDIKKSIKKNKIENKQFSIEDEIINIKKDIREVKISLNELVELIKSLYEFENS